VLSRAWRHINVLKLKQKTQASPCIKGSTLAVSTETAVPLSAKYTMEYSPFWPLWDRETGGLLRSALRDGANHPVTR
jgi:hypothetical protein